MAKKEGPRAAAGFDFGEGAAEAEAGADHHGGPDAEVQIISRLKMNNFIATLAKTSILSLVKDWCSTALNIVLPYWFLKAA